MLRILILATALLIVPVVSASAQDLDKGLAAYQHGDYATALRELRPLAERGDDGAQFFMGVMYNMGQGVSQDQKAALNWFSLAAEQGYTPAQGHLGIMYGLGEGVPQDYVLSHMWFNIAASSGDEDASAGRNMVADQMTPTQIEKAQDLARRCVAKNYKGC